MSDNIQTGGDTVLVIDDEPSVGRVVIDFLREEGYHPIFCSHPQEALECSRKNAVKLTFVDVNLPDMNGMVLASKLKKIEPSSEIVFMTGYGTFENAVQAIKLGAYDYLRKPFGLNELRLCLKRYQERQTLKKQTASAEARYADLVQKIPSVIWVLKNDFQLEFINRACAEVLGYSPDEAVNAPDWFLSRIHPDDREHIREVFGKAFNTGGLPFSEECRLIHKKGHVIHVILKSTPYVGDQKGEKDDRLEGIIVDISDRVFLEKVEVQREKLKTLGAVSAEVAHEIRNPLVSIGGFARRLQQKAPELPEGAIILYESRRLEKILKRITDYLEPVKVSYQKCSVNHIVMDCVKQLTPEMERLGVLCQLDLDPTLSAVHIDKDILTQISTLLILNTAKDMNQGGILGIRSFESDENVHLEFRNRDPKSKSKNMENFFMPFDKDDHAIGIPVSVQALRNMGGLLSFSQGEKDMVYRVSHPKGVRHISSQGQP
jgi:two-component system sensor histidine kinase HydH